MTAATEIRDAMPTIAKLVVTARRTAWDVLQGYNSNQQEVFKKEVAYPGIMAVIHPYYGRKKLRGLVYEFREKAIVQKDLDELKAKTNPDKRTLELIKILEATLSRTDIVWMEEVLSRAGITDLVAAFTAAFSDVLDQFPQLAEPVPGAPSTGFKVYIAPVQWDATISFDVNELGKPTGKNSVAVKIGYYYKSDLSDAPELEDIVFEDGNTRRAREEAIAKAEINVNRQRDLLRDATRILELRAMEQTPEVIDELAGFDQGLLGDPDLENRKIITQGEVERFENELMSLNAQVNGNMADLLGNVSLVGTIKALSMAIFAVKKDTDPLWADTNLEMIDEAFTLPQIA